MEELPFHGEASLPSFGLPVSEFPGKQFDPTGHRQRFPHVLADSCDSDGVSVRERRMLQFIDRITDKSEWERKVFDDEIVDRWRAKACLWKDELGEDYLSGPMFDYVSDIKALNLVIRGSHAHG
jgi:hypothetical protein